MLMGCLVGFDTVYLVLYDLYCLPFSRFGELEVNEKFGIGEVALRCFRWVFQENGPVSPLGGIPTLAALQSCAASVVGPIRSKTSATSP